MVTEPKTIALKNYYTAKSLGFYDIDHSNICVAENLQSLVRRKQYSSFLGVLTKLTIPLNCTIEVQECKMEGVGSRSRLYISINGNIKDFNIWEHIKVEDSKAGAWQAYLLNTLWHSLPFFWHGQYDARSYLYSKEDIKKIEFLHDTGIPRQELATSIQKPEVIQYGTKYFVACTYWTNWGGIVKELIEISIKDNHVVSFNEVYEWPLFPYYCNLCF